ncbi:MAG: hypothetical protein ACRDKX_04535 [Solirubrobacterales bacterium]
MERMAWTDERLDDLARRMDAGFERLDRDIRELRAETRDQIGSLRGEMGEMRGEMRELRTELGGQIDALRITMIRVGGGMMAGLLGMVAALIARGG